jgi:hypothetical protein
MPCESPSRLSIVALSLALGLAACGDDASPGPSSERTDGLPDTSPDGDDGPRADAASIPADASADGVAPETGAPDPTAVTLGPEDALVILDAAQGHLGPCAVGVSQVKDDGFVAWVQGTASSRHPLKKGDVLVCQALYRVVEVGDVSRFVAAASRPGVVIDRRPRSIPGLSVEADSIILNVGGTSEFEQTTFSNIRIDKGQGLFDLMDQDATKVPRSVAVGDLVGFASGMHKVLAVVPPAPGDGVAGWIEIASH